MRRLRDEMTPEQRSMFSALWLKVDVASRDRPILELALRRLVTGKDTKSPHAKILRNFAIIP